MINKIKNRGFTLVETLMAVTLLMVAIAGPLTIASKGLQATLIAKDQDNAFFLAQDAVEYVRWIRDTNRLSGGDWLTGAGGTAGTIRSLAPCEGTGGCYVDSTEQVLAAPSANDGSCTPLNYDSANHRFTCAALSSTVVPTIFTRTITLTTPIGGNTSEAQLAVTVSWCDQATACATTPRSVTVREELFNWQ